MRHHAISGLRPVLTGAMSKVIEFPSPMNGRITQLMVRIAAPNASGDAVFDVNINDVTVYASPTDRPKIVSGQTTGISIIDKEVTVNDMITVDLDAAPLGGISGLYVMLQLDDSPTVTQYITNIYQQALRRVPTGLELSTATTNLTNGCNGGSTLTATSTLLTLVFGSSEYTTSFGATNAAYAEDLYQAVLGRPSDPGGKAFWVAQLVGGMTRASLLSAFNTSIEHANQRVIGWCPQVLPLTNAIQLQGVGINATTPTISQLLQFNGTQWIPTTIDFLTKIFDFKDSVRVTSTANVNISSAPTAIDGVTLANGDRVLLKNQTTGSQNGIYVFNGAASAMTRSTDADSSAEVTAGIFVGIEEGTANADTFWWLTTNNPITLGTTALTFTQFGASGSPTGSAGGDLTGTYPNPTLVATAVTPGTYGSTTQSPQIVVDSKGRITGISNQTIAGGSSGIPADEVFQTEDDGFDSSSLDAKWTQTTTGTAPTVIIHNKIARSHYLAKFGAANGDVQLMQAFVPGAADFSITGKFSLDGVVNFQGLEMRVEDSGGTAGTRVAAFRNGTNGVVDIRLTDWNAGNIWSSSTGVALAANRIIYLHLKRVGGSWTAYYNISGSLQAIQGWNQVGGSPHTENSVMAKLYVKLFQGGATGPTNMGIDWFRRDFITVPIV